MKVPILMYHSIGEANNAREKRLQCSVRNFSLQMRYLSNFGYRVTGLDTLVNSMKSGTDLPEKTIVITFDDGFRDTYRYAFPILKKYNFPATVFIVSDLVNDTNKWMIEESYSAKELMTWEEIKEMSENGITIGAHTSTHPKLTALQFENAVGEIIWCKDKIEKNLGSSVKFFAYPYGDFNEQIKKAVEEAGYTAACSVRPGFNTGEIELYSLRRIAVHGTDSLWQFILKLIYGANRANIALPFKYYFNQIKSRLNV
jgi:peptidoglycan/xylan/chitin deacetylase (PgdA/CDA1 family)